MTDNRHMTETQLATDARLMSGGTRLAADGTVVIDWNDTRALKEYYNLRWATVSPQKAAIAAHALDSIRAGLDELAKLGEVFVMARPVGWVAPPPVTDRPPAPGYSFGPGASAQPRFTPPNPVVEAMAKAQDLATHNAVKAAAEDTARADAAAKAAEASRAAEAAKTGKKG